MSSSPQTGGMSLHMSATAGGLDTVLGALALQTQADKPAQNYRRPFISTLGKGTHLGVRRIRDAHRDEL